jgi:PAS domain S-box-containing protein
MPVKISYKTQKQWIAESEALRARLEEAEETLRAIRSGEVDALVVSGVDGEQIFTLKQTEAALLESEERYRLLFENSGEAFLLTKPDGTIISANPEACRIFGRSADEIRKIGSAGIMDATDPRSHVVLAERRRTGRFKGEVNLLRKDGTIFPGEITITTFTDPLLSKRTSIIFRDITERKLAEEALRTSENKLRSLFAAMLDVIIVYDADGRCLEIAPTNPANSSLPLADMVGKTVTELLPPGKASFFIDHIRQTLKTGKPTNAEYWLSIGSQVRWMSASVSPLSSNSVIWVSHDITESKAAEVRITRQLGHLTALSAIDRIIASIFDLNLCLSEILTQVTKELGSDAADILLLNANSPMLEFGAGRGFRNQSVKKAQIRLGKSYAGRAALERRLVKIPDLRNEPDNLLLTTGMAGEDFVCYYGVPLIVKGQVRGVLEIFHRSVLEPNAEWLDFLENLAGQIALAIENATLFAGLQRSNQELFLAYDSTIEGWSHALDLRDKETEGHSMRVTELTLQLAQFLGVRDEDMEHIRRGALLHDMGKIGIPDVILLKPGPLTADEWEVMRTHPLRAYELLSPISYLRPALDIPYCHHEHWDGSGYPRGLKGEAIPLAARIFAVSDVYDALCSNRPYREAWPKAEVLEHLKAGRGTHFDPRVLDVFLQMKNVG